MRGMIKKVSRTKNSIRNIKYAIVGQFTGLTISFINRMIFVHVLTSEYLGVGGLFTSILSMLSLAELGIGSAIVYSLYKPLAEKNNEKIKSLMLLYRKAYTIIGIAISILGILLTPFLGFFIKELPTIDNLRLIYILFVLNSAFSYFYSYKRSLIIADQKRHITTLYRYTFYFILNSTQIIMLLLTKNYVIYLILVLLNTILENYVISKKANKLYPYLLDKEVNPLDINTKATIRKNVNAMIFHKIGSLVVSGTDNILLSKYVGISVVGIYSNYLLIIQALHTVINMIYTGITSSIGNLGATESKEKLEFTFNALNFLGFWAYGISSIALVVLLNPFISIWLGDNYLFGNKMVLVIIINYYLTGMRRCTITFRDALGLYWYDRYKAIFESIINLVASMLLIHSFGAIGVLIGTTISTISTCFWVEPHILYKYGFGKRSLHYFKNYFKYTIVTLSVGLITWTVCEWLVSLVSSMFLFRFLIAIILPNLLFTVIFRNSVEFKYLINVARSQIFIGKV